MQAEMSLHVTRQPFLVQHHMERQGKRAVPLGDVGSVIDATPIHRTAPPSGRTVFQLYLSEPNREVAAEKVVHLSPWV